MNRLGTSAILWISMVSMIILHVLAPSYFSQATIGAIVVVGVLGLYGSSWNRWMGALPINRYRWLNREWLVNMLVNGPAMVLYFVVFNLLDGKGYGETPFDPSMGANIFAGLGVVSMSVPLEIGNRNGKVFFSWKTIIVPLGAGALLGLFLFAWSWDNKSIAWLLCLSLLLATWLGSYIWSKRLIAS